MKRKLSIFILAVWFIALVLTACDSIDEPENTAPIQSSSDTEPVSSDTVTTADDSSSADVTTSETTMTTTTIQVSSVTDEPDPIDTDNQIVQTAQALIGIAFAENGASPSEGFDNSGFIYYVLRENGFINCPRFTKEQAAMGINIGYDQLKSGDLAFFCTADSGEPDFGGIYIGDGQMIYSPMPGQTVKVADITSDYWVSSFVTGVSLS